MWRLVAAAPEIARLKELCSDYDVRLETSYGTVNVSWFAEHAGHRLVPISEYGNVETEQCCDLCGKPSKELQLQTVFYPRLLCEECREAANEWLATRRPKP